MALISMKANCHLSSDPTANEQLWYRKLGIRVLLPNIQEEKVLDQREDQKEVKSSQRLSCLKLTTDLS